MRVARFIILIFLSRNFIFLGGPTIVSMFIIPQRFQLSYGSSGFEAGVRLIPFTLALPAGSIFASRLAGKLKVPPLFLLLAGSCLQILGFALLGTLDFTLEAPARIYGYQILSGWGCGMNFSLLFVLIPFVIDGKYLGKSSSPTLLLSLLTGSKPSAWVLVHSLE